MTLKLPAIQHDKDGFTELVGLVSETEKCCFADITIDMSRTSWFDADMCAVLGAVLYRLNKDLNAVRLTKIPPNVEAIMSKNGFLSYYGGEKIRDSWGTTISYRRFDVNDGRSFGEYIENELIHRSEIPTMSSALLKKFRESLFEVFNNAVVHSSSQLGVFCCGQFFPKRNRLDFFVVDLGVGMRQNIKDCLGWDISGDAAISWATTGCNTTRQGGPIPSGLGLKLLGEFIDLNKGTFQIVSDNGFWKRVREKSTAERLDHPFPGTVVSLEIDTTDTNSYALASELKSEDIF